MHTQHSALVIGATGLVGRHLVQLLSSDASFGKICVVVRHLQPDFSSLDKVEQQQLDDFLLLNDQDVAGFSHVFSCLGSTQKKAGSKAKFYAIDYEINAHVADLLVNSSSHFLIVSALGAHPRSLIFYNRVKGELEQYLKRLNLAKLSILQPSLLIGERQESRFLEGMGQRVFKRFGEIYSKPFLSKPVDAQKVAACLLYAAKKQSQAIQVYDNLAIQNT